ncbi:MAG: hypothetical protein Q7V01_01940 [Vicinamibacterales bacterium]|nr:hypothetical protein [Vicinamibacterales bacterium]
MRRVLAVLGTGCFILALAASAQADVKSKQKSHVKFEGALGKVVNLFGGKAAKEGVVSTVALKGNRQLTTNDNTGELIDLDAEKIYSIDFKGKSYKVMTFAEMRRQIEEARAKAAESARGQGGGEAGQPGSANFEITVDVKKTGEQKALLGETCNQFIMTLTLKQKGKTLEQGGGMVITSDMWLGPEGSSVREQADFSRRYLATLLGEDGQILARDMMSAMAMYPGLQDGMARMQKETAKMQGTPYLTTVVFESVMTAEQAQARAEQDKNAGPGIGGIAGGIGGMFGRKKKDDASKDSPPAGAAKGRSTIMTSTSEVLSIEPSVSEADVEIPAGFKEKK